MQKHQFKFIIHRLSIKKSYVCLFIGFAFFLQRFCVETEASSCRLATERGGDIWCRCSPRSQAPAWERENELTITVKPLFMLHPTCPKLAGVQGVDWNSPLLQIPLYYGYEFSF